MVPGVLQSRQAIRFPVYVVVWPVAPGETAEHRRASQRLFDLPEEILTAPDPLAAILAANRRADEEAED